MVWSSAWKRLISLVDSGKDEPEAYAANLHVGFESVRTSEQQANWYTYVESAAKKQSHISISSPSGVEPVCLLYNDETLDQSEKARRLADWVRRLPDSYSHDLVLVQPLRRGKARQLLNLWLFEREWHDSNVLLKFVDFAGTDMAFYLGWMSSYIYALRYPSAIGFLLFIWQQGHSSSWALRLMTAVALSLWATFFLESWKRQSHRFAFEWNLDTDMDELDELAAPPRPEFRSSSTTINPISNVEEPYFPSWKRTLRLLISVPICLLCISFAAAFMFLYLELYEVLQHSSSMLMQQVPLVLYAIGVPILNAIYSHVANVLTQWENYRTEALHIRALVLKLVPFHCVNCYISLLYLLFVQRDLERLRAQLAALMITSQIIGQVVELGLPLMQRVRNPETSNALPVFEDVFFEFLEMAIQFGYVVLFGWAWPLAPLFAWLNNLIEIGLDAFKLAYLARCAAPRYRNAGIGVWLLVLETLSMFSVVIVCGAWAQNTWMNHQTWNLFASDWKRISISSLGIQIVIIIAVEHACVLLKLLIANWIDDIPYEIRVQLLRRRILNGKSPQQPQAKKDL